MITNNKNNITAIRQIFLIVLLIIASVFMMYSFKNKNVTSSIDKATALFKQGEQKLKEKDYNGAVELYSQAIDINPKYAQAYGKRGQVKEEFLKQHNGALVDFDKAIELNPRYSIAYHDRGLCKINLRKYEAAIEDFNQAIKLNPNYFKAYNSRGVAYGILKEYDKAVRDFDNSLKAKPNYDHALLNKIYAYINMKDYAAALENIEKTEKLLKKDKDEELIEKLARLKKLAEQGSK